MTSGWEKKMLSTNFRCIKSWFDHFTIQNLIFVTSNSFDFDIIFLRINHVFHFIPGKTKSITKTKQFSTPKTLYL